MMAKKTKVKMSITLDPKVRVRVVSEAERHQRSLSWIINAILERHFSSDPRISEVR